MKTRIFEQTRQYYLNQIAAIDLGRAGAALGMTPIPGGMRVQYFDACFEIRDGDIFDATGRPASFDVCVVLSRYLLMCPEAPVLDRNWRAFRDFKDAGPLLQYFAANVEGAITTSFANKLPVLKQACDRIGGELPGEDFAYDLIRRFHPLPRFDLLLLFNDTDSEFPAQCRVLFEACTQAYLDMECVAIVGNQLVQALHNRFVATDT